ncbi:interferon-stimulated 20 kDa exonuclease-like 2 [Scleropages formosus]|uniref:Interferon stimulated exonuclease 20 like 2 n=1 Tax=Scleropages formosus TaxID=113540 RepID=A0A8C9SSS3_SCLFO|nr:interferon-stimulated 20 kDa exonuclease-like 2 [Scleropages formosus]
MSGIIINLEVSHNDGPTACDARRKSDGKIKHEKFLKRRRVLERRCLLRSKQNQRKQKKQASDERPRKTDVFSIHSNSSYSPTNASHCSQSIPKKPKQGLDGKPFYVKDQDKKQDLGQPKFMKNKDKTPKQDREGKPKSMKIQDMKPFVPNLHTQKCSVLNPPASVKLTFPKSFSTIVTSPFESSSTSTQSKRSNPTSTTAQSSKGQGHAQHTAQIPEQVKLIGNPLKYLAIDCEMVGTGPKGRYNELARCSIVSYNGDVLYDHYIKPISPVTDFRTRWSGVTRTHLINAKPFSQAKSEILKILKGKVVVGHAIHNDFKALSYSHPSGLTRDTSCIPLLNKKAGFPEAQLASLKKLTKALLNKDIQVGKSGHSSVEDARASMELYKIVEVEWEKTLASSSI